MLKNYFTIALRNLRKHKGYAFINVAGLAVGLAVCLLIALYIQYELSYDDFHTKGDRIVRVTQHWKRSGRPQFNWALAPDPMAAALRAEYPEIEQTARIGIRKDKLVQYGEQRFYENNFAYADPTLFSLFDFEVLHGSPETDLARPATVFLSESMAQKYFGDEDPLGKSLAIDNEHSYEVTGIFKDLPHNSHLQFDFVASRETIYAEGQDREEWHFNVFTYLLLKEGQSTEALEHKLRGFTAKYMERSTASLVSLRDIHLYARATGDHVPQSDIRYIYLFSSIALLILAIACINYMNLATARASKRIREVGIRKVVGANRAQLVRQFLGESTLLTAVALTLSVALAEALLPFFSSLMERPLELGLASGWFVLFLVGMLLVVGLVAGSYPSLFLSAFKPAHVLKGQFRMKASSMLRKGLVTFQFGITVALIIGTLVIQRQMKYVQDNRPGFDQEQIITLPTRGGLDGQYGTFKDMLLQHPQVEQVMSTSSMLDFHDITWVSGGDVDSTTLGIDENLEIDLFRIDYDYFETLGLELIGGRAFSEAFPSDKENAIIINETTAQKLGWEEPLGKWINLYDKKRTVVGVVKDYHYSSHKNRIGSQLLFLEPNASRIVAAKVLPGDVTGALQHIEQTWNALVPTLPFQYSFYDDTFDAMYRTEQQIGRIFSAFAFLAILVACLGLFGLTAFTAEQRTKEIGIRKVLGATIPNIVSLLSRDFLMLVAIGFVCASPLAYFAASRWLEDFVYRIDLGVGMFLLAGSLALGIALLTVSYQSFKAARANPVESLRFE